MNPMLRDELAAILAEAMPSSLAGADYAPIDVSIRARMMRSIIRIADTHGWHDGITIFLENRGVSHLSDLSNPQLEDLLDRMEGYVDAAETGCSLEHGLPAY